MVRCTIDIVRTSERYETADPPSQPSAPRTAATPGPPPGAVQRAAPLLRLSRLASVNVPYLHARLPNSLKWRVLGALIKINERESAYTESTRRAILGALGAMNLAAAHGVHEGREAIVANLLAQMVSDSEAIASGQV